MRESKERLGYAEWVYVARIFLCLMVRHAGGGETDEGLRDAARTHTHALKNMTRNLNSCLST